MPTVAGDIVITHAHAMESWHSVWRVKLDGEQTPHAWTRSAPVSGGAAAMALARLMVRESGGGAIYFQHQDSCGWVKLSD